MRVNVYAEEMTNKVEIVTKEIDGREFTGVRFYLELPATQPDGVSVSGPFMHGPGDDDSSAVTFWGKREMTAVLVKALAMLGDHYMLKDQGAAPLGPIEEIRMSGEHDYHPKRVDTVGELIAVLSEFDKTAKVRTFSPFDPEGPCSWVAPRLNLTADGAVHIEMGE